MIKKSFEPVFLGFLACVLIVTATYAITRYSVEVGAQEQKAALTAAKQESYEAGWANAVMACSRNGILKGPLVLTGDSPSLDGMAITIVTIIDDKCSALLLTNSTDARVTNCRFEFASRSPIIISR